MRLNLKKISAAAVAATILLAVAAHSTPKAAYIWRQLEDGLLYTSYSFSISEKDTIKINAFMIDPVKFKLDVATAKDEVDGATAYELAQKSGALLMVNGGFFTPEHKTIGLVIRDGKQLSPLHNTSWWSVFTIKNGIPSILKPSQFKSSDAVDLALQAGPRLVVDGNIQKLKEGIAIRSAIGITKDKKVVIAITSGQGISMSELARRMKGNLWQGGLDCPDAMALDGGSSSQLYAKIGDFKYSQPGLARITNGLGIFRKSNKKTRDS